MQKHHSNTINKVLALVAFCFLCQLNSNGQNIDKLFVEMPQKVYGAMTNQQKLELMEYYKSELSDSIENRMRNKVTVLKLDTINQLLAISTSPLSTLELKLFKSEKQAFIGFIRTACAPICHSTVAFYTLKWKPIEVGFKAPKSIAWMKSDAPNFQYNDIEWAKEKLENSFVSLHFSADHQDIIAKNNCLDFMDEEDKKTFSPLLNSDDLVLHYNGFTWKGLKTTMP